MIHSSKQVLKVKSIWIQARHGANDTELDSSHSNYKTVSEITFTDYLKNDPITYTAFGSQQYRLRENTIKSVPLMVHAHQ